MALPETGSDAPKRDQRSVDILTRWFLGVWRWLDDSPLRQVWPFAVGVLLAFAAFRITGRILWAVGIVVVVYFFLHRLAGKATAHDQALRKTQD